MRSLSLVSLILFCSIASLAQIKIDKKLEKTFQKELQRAKAEADPKHPILSGSHKLDFYGLPIKSEFHIVEMDSIQLNDECPISPEEKEQCKNEIESYLKQYEKEYHSFDFLYGVYYMDPDENIKLFLSNNVLGWGLDFSMEQDTCYSSFSHNNSLLNWNDQSPQVKHLQSDKLSDDILIPSEILEFKLSSQDFIKNDFIYGQAHLKTNEYYVFEGLFKVYRTIELVFKLDTGNKSKREKLVYDLEQNELFGKASERTFKYAGITYSEVRTKFKLSGTPFKNGISCAIDINRNSQLVNEYGELIDTTKYQNLLLKSNDSVFYARKNDKWGVINRKGKIIIPFNYDYTSSGYADPDRSIIQHGLIKMASARKSGFLNLNGDTIIPFEYYDRYNFPWKHQMKILEKNNRTGVIDHKGKTVIPFENYYVGILGKESFIVKDTNKVIYILNNGKKKILNYERLEESGLEGSVFVKNADHLWGMIDQHGDEIIPCHYRQIQTFSEGKSFVSDSIRRNKYLACIDDKGKLLTDYIFGTADDFENGLAYVSVHDPERNRRHKTFINHDLEIISKDHFRSSYDFKYGVSKVDTLYKDDYGSYVSNSNHSFILSKDGMIHSFAPGHAVWQLYFSDGLIAYEHEGKQGYLDTEGNVAIEAKYERVAYFSDGKTWVKKPLDDYMWILSKPK